MLKESSSLEIYCLQVSQQDLKSTQVFTQSLENPHAAGPLQAIHPFQLISPLDINVSRNRRQSACSLTYSLIDP